MSYRDSEYLIDDTRRRFSREEQGVLALLRGLDTYTKLCAPAYADECAANEMGIPAMFDCARSMLTYAPDSLRRGAIDSALIELLRQWHVDPDTLQWDGGS